MKYSNEEKLSIITRYQQGERITALSNELAISRSTLYRWLKFVSFGQHWKAVEVFLSRIHITPTQS